LPHRVRSLRRQLPGSHRFPGLPRGCQAALNCPTKRLLRHFREAGDGGKGRDGKPSPVWLSSVRAFQLLSAFQSVSASQRASIG
jgi:hypothetical protein